MKKTIKLMQIITLVLLLLTLIIGIVQLTTNIAYATTRINKVLFLANDENELNILYEECKNDNLSKELYDVELLNNVDIDIVKSYVAIALPGDVNSIKILNNLDIKNYRIYLYGSLTITDYKAITGIDSFTVNVDVINTNNANCVNVNQFFEKQYEDTEKFNVICYGKNTLLGSISSENITLYQYLYTILDNCEKYLMPTTRTTIIDSKFEFTTAMFGGTLGGGVVHMDYTLYRNYDENSANYDYFGIKTKTWLTSNKGRKSEIKTKYILPNIEDNLLETGPASIENAKTINATVGFGSGGVNGAIGINVDLSNTNPSIVRTEDYTNDSVEWKMTNRKWLPSSEALGDSTLDCVATWASVASKKMASIDVYFGGTIKIGPNYQYPKESEYKLIPIRFNY